MQRRVCTCMFLARPTLWCRGKGERFQSSEFQEAYAGWPQYSLARASALLATRGALPDS